MDFVTTNYIWAITAFMSGAGLIILTIRQKVSGPRLSPAQATQLINREDAQVIDVREQAEWSKGHINGARHIPAGEVAQRLGELEESGVIERRSSGGALYALVIRPEQRLALAPQPASTS